MFVVLRVLAGVSGSTVDEAFVIKVVLVHIGLIRLRFILISVQMFKLVFVILHCSLLIVLDTQL